MPNCLGIGSKIQLLTSPVECSFTEVRSRIQEEAIQRLIIAKRPDQLKMDFSLWSRAAVGQLIDQEFGIKLQVRSIGKYLTRWGFTAQKPIKRAYEQSPEAVQNWLQGEYPCDRTTRPR